ncbi:hypothetical protein E1176_11740 [Fulvivirga sp. RKSG066]|uniref:DUF5996 family protein n=1 Tax=Fulvivirga aurantia TaxID=2529383 RepID=UPI0012BC4255|nr:DUF5996 family protein [Fulvivirga aurantia]MTI21694.1 hypothetical protein [Fulvivirga aurantia]
MKQPIALPKLQYKGFEKNKLTLHLYLQILGKIRMGAMPRKNHWWYITEYISTEGITTGNIPYREGTESFNITLNIHSHSLHVSTSTGKKHSFNLGYGFTVAQFYDHLIDGLKALEIPFMIYDKPFDLNINKPFRKIKEYHHYDKTYTQQFWHTMLWVSDVFKEFSGRFYGKTCPVHLYWHSLDLAVTRFSGKKAPQMDAKAHLSDKDAYTHECISFGFWAGDENMQEPAFYSYTYPSPDAIDKEPLSPSSASWIDANGSPMAILRYNDVCKSTTPRKELLDFMESAYQAGAKLAGWPIDELTVPALKDI